MTRDKKPKKQTHRRLRVGPEREPEPRQLDDVNLPSLIVRPEHLPLGPHEPMGGVVEAPEHRREVPQRRGGGYVRAVGDVEEGQAVVGLRCEGVEREELGVGHLGAVAAGGSGGWVGG